MTVIHIGPNSYLKKKLWKEYQANKFHPDVVLVCDDGTTMANRLFLAAQSKFLTSVLKQSEAAELAEIILPGVKVKYVERVLRFMYSGKLCVTNKELYRNYLVWHVKEIIQNVFRLDANIDLGALNLEAPPEGWQDPDPGPDGSAGGSGGGSNNRSGTSGSSQSNATNSNKVSQNGNFSYDTGGFRQHVPLGVPVDESLVDTDTLQDSEDVRAQDSSAEEAIDARLEDNDSGPAQAFDGRMTPSSDIVELEVPAAPTPDIVDLIDSDEDENENSYGQGSSSQVHNDEPTIVMDNAEDGTERIGGFHLSETPKILSRLDCDEGEENEDGDANSEQEENNSHQSPPRTKRASLLKKRKRKAKRKSLPGSVDLGNGIKKIVLPKKSLAKKRSGAVKPNKDGEKIILPISTDAIKTETPVAEVIPYKRCEDSNTIAEKPLVGPGMVVHRGKVVSMDQVPVKTNKPTAMIEGVRKYNPNGWTLTGIRKVESLITVKTEKAIHPCPHCPARYEVYKSLEVHIQRTHNEKKTKCPECGKGLSGPGSIKKHLLTHRPEEEWPFECPLCHKRFQARADIPKHLMSNVHKYDKVPKRNSPEWFALLYPEKKDNIGEMMQQVEARKEKEREKLQQFPEELGLTLQEFDEFTNVDPESTNNESSHSTPSSTMGHHSGIGGGSKRKAEDDPSVYMPFIASDQANNSGGEGRKSQRAAAINARSFLSGINEYGAL